MIVTDVKRKLKSGQTTRGFYMQGYLASNLLGIPGYLKKSWDCVGIVSGHGLVRVGKSTMAMQVCYYLAWLRAGGQMILSQDKKGRPVLDKIIAPKEKVRFDLYENVAFSAQELQEKAIKVYNKYGKSQVLLYDEGRQGLDSARSMESINKGMEDFFQECGFMGHIIIIVLPNFFKLHEDYAVARSLFLIDVFADSKNNRGYFNFYDLRRKEMLYFFGKKRIGVSAKYAATAENFWGRFTGWIPFDKDEYEALKKRALKKKRQSKRNLAWKRQRDIAFFLLRSMEGWKIVDIAEKMTQYSGEKITPNNVQIAIAHITKEKPSEIQD